MTLTTLYTQFVNSLTNICEQYIYNAARLAHVEDGAAILLPNGVSVSRYTFTPVGDNLASISATLTGLNSSNGTTAMIASAVAALQDADLAITSNILADSENLLNGELETLVANVTYFISDIQTASPYHSINILFALANDFSSNDAYEAMINVVILNALAKAIVSYNPTTSNEAQNLLNNFVELFDTTLPLVSNLGWSETAQSLNTLRMQACSYLQTMIAQRPQVLTQTFAESLPDVVVAYMLYQDATRAEELTQMNNPDSPMFLPTIVNYKSK